MLQGLLCVTTDCTRSIIKKPQNVFRNLGPVLFYRELKCVLIVPELSFSVMSLHFSLLEEKKQS